MENVTLIHLNKMMISFEDVRVYRSMGKNVLCLSFRNSVDQDSNATRLGFSFGRWGISASGSGGGKAWLLIVARLICLGTLAPRRDSFYTLGPKTANTLKPYGLGLAWAR